MNETAHIQVIDRMVGLLDSLARHEQASLKVLSADTGLHPSTAHRILSTLLQHGWVARSAEGGYQLGSGLRHYALRAEQQVDLRELALPIMSALRDATGETVNLTQGEGDEVVYIERAVSRHLMRVEQVVGSRAPLHATAVGKLMLAAGGAEACAAYAARTGLPSYTANTITDVGVLWAEADIALQQGYAFDNEEAEMGIVCIAVLVRDASGSAVAGLSISAPRERRQEFWTPLLVESGQTLSSRLGYRKPD